MPSASKPEAHTRATDTTAAVDAFMGRLEHPRKPELEALRRLVLAADPSIAEGIKWNAPSFRTTEYFATFNLRGGAGIRVILHRGAKARDLPAHGLPIDDPDRLLEWLGEDRAMIEFDGPREIEARASAFRSILRQWIARI